MEWWAGHIAPTLQDSITPIFDMDPVKITIDGREVVTTKGKTSFKRPTMSAS